MYPLNPITFGLPKRRIKHSNNLYCQCHRSLHVIHSKHIRPVNTNNNRYASIWSIRLLYLFSHTVFNGIKSCTLRQIRSIRYDTDRDDFFRNDEQHMAHSQRVCETQYLLKGLPLSWLNVNAKAPSNIHRSLNDSLRSLRVCKASTINGNRLNYHLRIRMPNSDTVILTHQ